MIESPPLCNSADLIAASHRRRNRACSTYPHDNWRRYGMRLNRRVGFNAIINSSLENLSWVVVCITSFRWIFDYKTVCSIISKLSVQSSSTTGRAAGVWDMISVMFLYFVNILQPATHAIVRGSPSGNLQTSLMKVCSVPLKSLVKSSH